MGANHRINNGWGSKRGRAVETGGRNGVGSLKIKRMNTIIKLDSARRTRADRKTLCRSGFHKWQVEANARFDVKRGKLLTAKRCRRGGETRVRRT